MISITSLTPTLGKYTAVSSINSIGVALDGATAVSVHRAKRADATVIANISRRGFAATHKNAFAGVDLARYLADTFNPHQIAAEIHEANNIFLLAEVAGSAVGTVRLSLAAPPDPIRMTAPIALSRFYLRPEWVGHGVGSALMLHALGTAVSTGHKNCWLCVWEENDRAISFYRRWGFHPAGSDMIQIGQSCPIGLVMIRPL